MDYVLCGQGVKTQWEVTDAWHCQTTSDHNAVYVVFNRNPNPQDPSNCSQLQEQEDLGEDLWGVSSKTADGDVRIRKGKRRVFQRNMALRDSAALQACSNNNFVNLRKKANRTKSKISNQTYL